MYADVISEKHELHIADLCVELIVVRAQNSVIFDP